MFQVRFTEAARDHLRRFEKFDQRTVLDGIERLLAAQPGVETRNQKRLRPNRLAEWELRIGDHRVFYDVDGQGMVVRIIAIGVKEHGKLRIGGLEYEL